MPIVFRCQTCNQKLSAPSRKAGTEISCPACKNRLTVPTPDAAEIDVEAESIPEAEAVVEPEELLDEDVISEFEAKIEEPSPVSYQPAFQETDSDDDEGDEDEGLEFRKADTESDDMDLTPMVDVTFLLLIFFMITASFSIQKTIQVPPPDPEQQGAVAQPLDQEDLEKVSIEVVIDENNTITVDDEPLADPSGIVEAIQSKMRSEQKGELMLTTDVDALHETWVLVIDAATEAGIQKIRTVTTGE